MFLINRTAITNDRIIRVCGVKFLLCRVRVVPVCARYKICTCIVNKVKMKKSKFQLPALCLSFQVFLNNSLFVTESTSLLEKHRLNRAKLIKPEFF